ncbi:MAG TPA: LacI family transcriptional regulator [Phycisphaerales bacterium]|nr:LacI family transcriptional regulator [Phycisphaerales bacterium]
MSQLSQRKIAEAMGVSVMTVSRALRDHPDLAVETTARIVKMAREMGYTSPKADGVEKTATRRVSVIAYERSDSKFSAFDSDIQRAIFLALQRECQDNGVETVIELAKSGQIPKSLENQSVESAFIFGRYTHDDVAVAPDIPKLAISSYIADNPLWHVVADNATGSRLVTEYLISQGHRRIAFLGDKDPLTELYQQRADGYTIAMIRAGLIPDVRYQEVLEYYDVASLIDGNSAVVVSSDSSAFGLITMLDQLGVSVPDDLSLAGFDNLYELCHSNHLKPRMELTTYGPDWSLMGKIAARTLLFRSQDLQGPPVRITVPGRLVVGKSSARAKISPKS